MDGFDGLESDSSEEKSLVVDWEAFFSLDHGLELSNGVGIVYLDLDSLGRVYFHVDFVASGEFDQRSFSEGGFSASFRILKQDLVELESLNILWDSFRCKYLVLDA